MTPEFCPLPTEGFRHIATRNQVFRFRQYPRVAVGWTERIERPELWEQDGLSHKELVVRLHIERATMVNTLTRMERDGLVVRKKHLSDGRVQRVWLTDCARDLRGSGPAIEAARAENAAALSGLSEDEQYQLIARMQKVIATR